LCGAGRSAWCGSSTAASRLGYPWRCGSSLARECVHINARGRTHSNRCTRLRAMTEGWRLGAVEVDKGGAPRGGDAVLRMKEHSRERLAHRWFGDARVRASGREARPRPARRKTGKAQRRGGGVQHRRGTNASTWMCVHARVRTCAGSETRWRAKAQRQTAPERKGKGLMQQARERAR
jgi:hypothetical protein